MTAIEICATVMFIGLVGFIGTMLATDDAPGAFVFAVLTILGLVATLVAMFVEATNGRL